MTQQPSFDAAPAHRYFSTSCFNEAWQLIDKVDRSAEDELQMILLAHASLWHWTQQEDCTSRNLSIGYWQASRIYSLLGQSDNARRYGQLCLDISQQENPFYLGFAYESLARAESVAGNREQAIVYPSVANERMRCDNKSPGIPSPKKAVLYVARIHFLRSLPTKQP